MYTLLMLSMFIGFSSAFNEVCCEPSGDCFTDEAPFDQPNWPLPQCLTPTYTLYRSDLEGSVNITRGNTPPEYINEEPTVYLVHGWIDIFPGWAEIMKDEFLANQTSYNVIVADWLEGANQNLTQSASNTRSLGSELAAMNNQLSPKYSWCIGHSLGVHACGHAGKRNAGLDRISGLDPTGPNFDEPGCANMTEVCRLDKSDAPQVDNIHVDAAGIISGGTFTPLGHMDFYPNGGIAEQPGCENGTIECSHGKAMDYFTASINNDCFFVNQQCTDPMDLPGSCGPCPAEGCPNMGASAENAEGIFYLETLADFPYC